MRSYSFATIFSDTSHRAADGMNVQIQNILKYFLAFFLLVLGFISLSTKTHADRLTPTEPVKSGYLHHLPEKTCVDTSNSQETWQQLEKNTAFLNTFSDDDEGLCFGLACAYLQASLSTPNSREQLSEGLEVCSQKADVGWNFFESHWVNLQDAFKYAQEQYAAYRQAYGRSDNPATLQDFSRTDREAAQLIKAYAWMRTVSFAQSNQLCTYFSIEETRKQPVTVTITQAWPVAATEASIVELLRDLRKRPVPAHYLLTTGSHAIALSIEAEQITLFDQNIPCYFKQSRLKDSDVIAADLFHALNTRPGCRVTLDDTSAHIQCGADSMFVPDGGAHDMDEIRRQMDSLKSGHPVVIMTLQQVFPESTSLNLVRDSDVTIKALIDDLDYLFPVPPGTTDSEGYTRLHLASREGNIRSVEKWLYAGENPGLRSSTNSYNEQGITAIELADARKHADVVKLLQAFYDTETNGQSDLYTAEMHRFMEYQRVDYKPVPEDLHQAHWESIHKHSSPDTGQYCQSAVGCGGSFEFRKAIVAIGRGEDPVSQGIERTVQGMVKISYAHFPEETQKVLNGLAASGEAVDAVVDFADRTTGRVVSKKWNSLDQVTRDELAGYGKVFSVVVPAAKARGLSAFSKNTKNLNWNSWQKYEKAHIGNLEYAKIGKRFYTHHAIDRMQPSTLGKPAGADTPGRNISPNIVEYIIQEGTATTVLADNVPRTIYRSGSVSVVTEQQGKIIVTILRHGGEK